MFVQTRWLLVKISVTKGNNWIFANSNTSTPVGVFFCCSFLECVVQKKRPRDAFFVEFLCANLHFDGAKYRVFYQ